MFRKSLRYLIGLLLILNSNYTFAGGSCSTTIPPCPGFTTYTQGGWGGSNCNNGFSPSSYLTTNFAAAFPSGLTIGCTNKIVLTTATAVKNFLPQGSTARTLNTGTLTNPSKTTYSNVLAGQLVTAMLNVGFDNQFAAFGSSSTKLGNLVISSGVFQNWTVNQLITDANNFIGGCPSPSGKTAADYNTALTNINQSYDNGIAAGNYLLCPIEFTATASPVKCFGGSTGSASITNIIGGAGATYTILWSTGSTRFSINNLVAGTYYFTITDAIGLTKTGSVTITQPTQLLANATAGNIACYGGTTMVNVSANGGTPPYTGTGTFTIGAGYYNYTITDANSCNTTTSVMVNQPTQLTATATAGTIACYGGTTTITVAANGGTAPYTGTGTFTVSAGSYSYTVTDANGCSVTKTGNITQPTQLTATATAGTIACYGGTTTVTVAANGGTAPYTGTGTFSVSAGSYSYTITDANGCSVTTSVIVTEPSLLTASSSAGSILCNGGSTTVTVGANGGTTPYTGTGNFTNKTAGTYNYTVTDANGCTATTSVTITQPSLLTANSSAGSILCNGGSTTVTVGANGGTNPYTGTGNFTNKTAGTYSYAVTDANGCTATTSVTVAAAPSAIAINGTKTDDNSCNGGSCSGTVSLIVNGSVAPYNYTWTNNASTGNSAIGFCSGTSTTVTVTDANGCSATQTYSFTCTPSPCAPCSGYVSYTQGGWGATPSGNNPGTILNSYFSTAFPNGLTIGCTNKLVFTTAAAVRAFLPSSTTARTLNTGTLTNPTSTSYRNVLAGQLVAAMLTARIDASINSFAPSGQKFENLVINSGTFKNMTVAQVINAANQFIGGCSTTYTASDLNTALTAINQSWDNGITCGGTNILSCPISVTKTVNNNPCYGDSKGSITLNVCGGCGTYNYSWSNNSITKNLSNLTTGTYIVTITDNCGLIKKDTTTITQPQALSVIVSSTDDNSCNDGICSGTASVLVTGGTSPYNYNWNIGGNTASISGICFGTNPTVTIADANACTTSSNFTISCIPNSGTCDPLTTFTQGGWGAAPNGNNPGTYLSSNFNSAFSKGLVIGFGTSVYTFTSTTAIQKVLPASGTPATLTAPFITNPTTVNNVFAGQLIAASLNVGFDYYDPNFATPTRNLGTMYCNFAPFLGMTVDQVILEANQAIGGKSTVHSIPDLTMALDFINRNYDNGIDDNGDLICNDPNALKGIAPQTGSAPTNSGGANNTTGFNLFPNPTNNSEVVLQFNSAEAIVSMINIYSMTGQLLLNQSVNNVKGTNTIQINLNSINQNNSMVIVQLINGGQISQTNLALTR